MDAPRPLARLTSSAALGASSSDPSTAADAPPAVTLLCQRFWPDAHGGVETRMLHLANALAHRGASVNVLTENRTGAAACETLPSGARVRRLDPMDPGRMWRWDQVVRVQWWWRHIRELAPADHVLWATDPIQAAAAILAGRGESLVYNPACCPTAMNAIARRHPFTQSTMRQGGWICGLDGFAYRRAAVVVAASDNLRRQLTDAHGPRGVYRVHHGVEAPADSDPAVSRDQLRRQARRQLDLPEATPLLLGFVGRLDPCKHLDFLFEAMTHDACPRDARLLIVGDGPDHDRLLARAQELGVADRLHWAGRLADPTPAYDAMDVFVLPSVYEAFGNVLPEAMARGVPVVARAADGANTLTASDEIIAHGQSGLVCDAVDVGSMAKRLAALRDPETRRSMAHAAQALARGRTWSDVADDYLRMLTVEFAARPLRSAA